MCVQGRQHCVEPRNAVVVEKQSHPHPALCRGMDRFQQQRSRTITVPDVVLQIEAALGRPGEGDTRGKGFPRIGEQFDPGGTRMARALFAAPRASAVSATSAMIRELEFFGLGGRRLIHQSRPRPMAPAPIDLAQLAFTAPALPFRTPAGAGLMVA